MNGGHPIQVNLTIKLEFNEGLERQVERLIDVLATAQHKWEDDDEDDNAIED